MYNNLIDRISTRAEAIFSEIESIYNFEKGDEFEIAVCKLLIAILPEKFGVCRGHVITKDDKEAGDDIIIYDKHNFPLLRLLNEDNLWRKQFVPIEAVYCYIETKHTIHVNGDEKSPQSLLKALHQVSKFKKLSRVAASRGRISKFIDLGHIEDGTYWPDIANPMYGCVIARKVQLDNKTPSEDIRNGLYGVCQAYSDPQSSFYKRELSFPDMIIAGKNNLLVPAIDGMAIPFFLDGKSKFSGIKNIEGKALGIGLANLIFSISSMRLGEIYWPEILANSTSMKLKPPKQKDRLIKELPKREQ